ncbi:sarcosine oxidase subunit gamma [Salinifilum aidingensis]
MTVVDEVAGTAVGARELRRSPLAHRTAELAERSAEGLRGVRLAEEPFLAQVDLRTDPSGAARGRVERELGTPLPHRTPDRVTGDRRHAALRLGPDEWLLVAPDGQAGRVTAAVREALGGSSGTVVDVSAQRTTLRLSGARSRDVLEKLCSTDLHPRAFGPGQCAQVLVGRAQVVLWQVADEPAYRIMVRCSFAEYLADLLVDAMAEFTAG